MHKDQQNRVELAIEQLHIAIDLFLTGRSFVSALTLAGAADEVLGRKAERFGTKKTISVQYEVITKLLEKLQREAPTFKEFAKERNETRNAVKHMAPDAEEFFIANLASEAVAKIGSACNNYENCGLPLTDKMREFTGWYLGEPSV